MQRLQFVTSENVERREAGEVNLASLNDKHSDVESNISTVSRQCSELKNV